MKLTKNEQTMIDLIDARKGFVSRSLVELSFVSAARLLSSLQNKGLIKQENRDGIVGIAFTEKYYDRVKQ